MRYFPYALFFVSGACFGCAISNFICRWMVSRMLNSTLTSMGKYSQGLSHQQEQTIRHGLGLL